MAEEAHGKTRRLIQSIKRYSSIIFEAAATLERMEGRLSGVEDRLIETKLEVAELSGNVNAILRFYPPGPSEN